MSNEVEFEYTGLEEREDVPRDVTIVRFHSSVIEVGDYMFQHCQQLKNVVLNEGLQKIGENSFGGCNELEHINFPSTLLEISERSFYNCAKLKDVVLNEGLQTIGNFAFYSCYLLNSITLPSTITDIAAFCGCSGLREVILNNALQTVGKSAFASCASLERITIPPTTTEISDNAFYCCRNLREVVLHEGIQMIASDAFCGCLSLERLMFRTLSTRLDTIIRAGQTEVEDKVEEIRGIVERRGSEMFISDAVSWVRRPNWWIPIKDRLDGIDRLITYYELKEATTLLELAIWKAKVDQAEAKPSINRDVHRIDIPGPVKNTILHYLNFRV